MEQSLLAYLLERQLTETNTPEERILLESWYLEEAKDSSIIQNSDKLAEVGEEIWDKITTRVLLPEHETDIADIPISHQTNKLWTNIGIAAAIVLIVFTAGLIYLTQDNLQLSIATAPKPGINKAYLLFPNGKRLDLNILKKSVAVKNNQFVYEDGSAISSTGSQNASEEKPSNPELSRDLISAITPKGGTYNVILPDGTKVWLNASSSLRFPSSFINKPNRMVYLDGEAYFEVSKDKRHPFIITTGRQKVEVLGTHFNISCYSDEPHTKTALLQGSISLTPLNGINKIIVRPGELVTLGKDGLKVEQADLDLAVAWKAGFFSFRDSSLEEVMRQISRWYDVEVLYKDQELRYKTFSGEVSKYSQVSELLYAIQKTGVVKFKAEGRKIIVSP